MSLIKLKEAGEAPEFLTEEGYQTLSKGYLLEGETPRAMYRRVADSSAKFLKKPQLANTFFEYMWKNWLCPASPVVSNCGTERGLPISCFGQYVPDTLDGIFNSYHESAMLTKYGGGIGKYWGAVRGQGEIITNNGYSEGIIPWLKNEDSIIQSVGQGGVRRGSSAAYLDIDHRDIEEFIDIRRPSGDISRRCLSTSFHHAVSIGDDFMERARSGDAIARNRWTKLLTSRIEMGEPYIMFKDTANRTAPKMYQDLNLKINTSQLCNEIFLHNDENHTFVCCLSSLNLARYDEWKDTNLIQMATWFLDGIMEEFIHKAKKINGFERAVRFSEKSRALGLGVLGWHTLLQQRLLPFDSYESMMLNAEIFKKLDSESLIASRQMAIEYGEPEWCKGYGVRNTHRIAVAPTTSNSLLSGGVSQGVEPIAANMFAQKSAKGTFIRKNPTLHALLASKGLDTFDIWNQINIDGGSVQWIKGLSNEEKQVFLAAKEINQHAIIKQAGQRQKWIDQSQSINLFFAAPATLNLDDKKKLGKYLHEVHYSAWKEGLKGLYYVRPESVIKGDNIYRNSSECAACEG